MPPPQESQVNYDELYPVKFTQPNNYIRFSHTVEECIGCGYDMTEDDDAFLASYNQGKAAASQLSEDVFEQILEVFEDTASISTPFASVDQTVIAYDVMVPGLSQLDTANVMSHAKEIYEYWKSQRQAKGGSLHPSLKFETHQENDDLDPYVCFRRREVRQTRKTRARDVQSADRLKRLRRELEDGRQLVILSHDRELLKRDVLNVDRMIFEQRAKLKDTKVRLGIKTDDDDLINQKVSSISISNPSSSVGLMLTASKREKRKAPEPLMQRPPGSQLRFLVRPDGRSAEADLVLLKDFLAEKENEFRAEIETKIENHRKWNANHIDLTRQPLAPVRDQSVDLSFRPAKVQYLMTPPTSVSNGSMEEPEPMDLDDDEEAAPAMMLFERIRKEDDVSSRPTPAFRRRIGRNNRLWIDRRGLPTPPRETSGDGYSDRWKYDNDDSDDEQPVYEVDPFDIRALKYRAGIPLYSRRVEPSGNGVIHVNGTGAGGRTALPAPQQKSTAAPP